MDPELLIGMIEGTEPPKPWIMEKLEQEMDIPRRSWGDGGYYTKRPTTPPGPSRRVDKPKPGVSEIPAAPKKPIAPRAAPGHDTKSSDTTMDPATAEYLFKMGEARRRARKIRSRVHDALDRLGWTVEYLAELINGEFKRQGARTADGKHRTVSRASVQNWAQGQRQVGPRGRSKPHSVRAPLDVRAVALRLSTAEAKRTHVGDLAIIQLNDWPNVEDDADTDV